MMVIDPVKLVNELEHQRRTWETQFRETRSTPQIQKIRDLEDHIKGLAKVFGLRVQQGGYY